jgi:hypothetical protein
MDERIIKKNARITSAFFGENPAFCTKGDMDTFSLKFEMASLKLLVADPTELGVLTELA